ncbi:MAG: outer membrane beta-barrel protein [Nitrospiraceae bacterium]
MARTHTTRRTTQRFARLVLAVALGLSLPALAQADDRTWRFSISAFGGKSFAANQDVDINCGSICNPTDPYHGTAHGVQLQDAPSFGGKVTAWYTPRNYDWQPQIGLQLDWTRFTGDVHPQTQGATGTVSTPGMQLGSFTFAGREIGVNVLAMNLMFRYPIGVSPSLPEGRWYPYVGIGGGVQRANMTYVPNGERETSYTPAYQVMAGVNIFIFKNLAIFGELKRTSGTHTFTYNGTLGDRTDRWTITSNHVTGGVSLHF